nr:hypothetical protein CFP56_52873 [Quercus suber]
MIWDRSSGVVVEYQTDQDHSTLALARIAAAIKLFISSYWLQITSLLLGLPCTRLCIHSNLTFGERHLCRMVSLAFVAPRNLVDHPHLPHNAHRHVSCSLVHGNFAASLIIRRRLVSRTDLCSFIRFVSSSFSLLLTTFRGSMFGRQLSPFLLLAALQDLQMSGLARQRFLCHGRESRRVFQSHLVVLDQRRFLGFDHAVTGLLALSPRVIEEYMSDCFWTSPWY